MYIMNYVILYLFIGILGYGDCCTFPTDLQNGTWYSSDMGDVTFNSSHFSVTSLANFGAVTFECKEVSGDRYYTESATFTFLGGNKLKAAMCFTLYQMTSYKYAYYPQTPILANTDTLRIFLKEETYSFTSSETCSVQSNNPSQARMFVRSGYANQTASTCENPIAGEYEYNVTGSSCNTTSLNTCNDRTELVFNYTLCSTVMAHSAGGRLYCMWSTTVSDVLYTMLYNQDASTDESTYYRFTCLVSRTNGSTVDMTTYPRACLDNQTSTVTTSPGFSAFLTANYTCATYPSSASSSAEVFAAGAAAAIALALIILIVAVVVVVVFYYFKVHKKKKITPDGEAEVDTEADVIPAKSPPIGTNINEEEAGRVSPFSPYPTVSELACYRFGPEPATVDIDDDDGGMTLEATTPGFTEGRRTKYEKDNESQTSLPVYSEVGDPTPDPTRLSEVQTRMSEITITENVTDPTPFTMTRATMNIPEENTVSPIESPREAV